ncbi:efflux RND transporter periplasmic adaptor subunit [Thiorhodococcus minor]|uniref:Efflux RND transporter periplasmic adaptor subunit n=1 Tax=Thiorhodococcus minor TaxID=57489 RepID=A0A6M0JY01_9GAMM|nr:efflux RND transporter periplasmic adaptor subunit [Thiorhodococcus minor]NEV62029.1 efflux RND transporter periplasmic adaptor subunit [Thiorhodococcus minor]
MVNFKMIAAAPLLLLLAAQALAASTLETARVQSQPLPREYKLDGVIEAVNRTTVSAQTQGQVEALFYDVDDVVEKGAVLARLKDTEHRARVGQAAADLKSAAARLQQAKDEYERVAGLYRKRNVSESAMDKAEADLASAQADLDAATARLEQAQEQLAYTKIRAPYSGIVTHRHVELGEIASPGSPVMSGISLDELRVIVDVPQSVIPSVRTPEDSDARVRVYLPDGEVVESGKITVFPFADLGSNTFKVRIDLPPTNGDQRQALFPGMLVKTGFVIGEKSALTVPREAVVHRSEVTGVYVVGPDGRIAFRLVRLGKLLPDAYVVLAGLSAGEQIALDPIAAGVALKSQLEELRQDRAEQTHG